MSESADSRRTTALKRLAEHLAALQGQTETPLAAESDMLSLIVSDTLHGANLAQRYPAFYQKLLENRALREAFLDALESVEAENASELVPLPAQTKPTLDFLKLQSPAPIVESASQTTWHAVWQRSLEQLQAIFSPPRLAYRADPLMEDSWFTLLREELITSTTTYEFALECSLAAERENALAASINLAVTLGSPDMQSQFPLRAHLQWGEYDEIIELLEEGRMKFPDIPLTMIFDSATQEIHAGLSFTLESAD